MSRAEKNGAHRSTHVRSIERALAILEQLASSGTACSLSGLASSVGLPSGTTHRVVQTLVAHGYVRQLETREYVLGPSLVGLGNKALQGTGIGAEPHLRKLADATGATAGLAILDGADVVFIAQAVPRDRAVRVVLELGERAPFASSAIVDAILASLPSGTWSRVLTPQACRSYCDRDAVARIEQVRRRGYSVEGGQGDGGVVCLAAGLSSLEVPAAVVLLGVGMRPTSVANSAVVRTVQSTASALKREIERRRW
jgi:IclR family acetate operon transcriptional repressor